MRRLLYEIVEFIVIVGRLFHAAAWLVVNRLR